MAPRHALGPLELLTLTVVLSLGDGAYAVPIRDALEHAAGHAVARGALYTTLARLEAKGLLRSRLGEPTPVRGGRAKRYYSLTPAGAAALHATQTALADAWQRAARLLGGAG